MLEPDARAVVEPHPAALHVRLVVDGDGRAEAELMSAHIDHSLAASMLAADADAAAAAG